jgi:hypothetical protein
VGNATAAARRPSSGGREKEEADVVDVRPPFESVERIRRARARAFSESPVCTARQHPLKQFEEMRKLMKQVGGMAKSGRLPRIPGITR